MTQISYAPLWKKLVDKDMSKLKLASEVGISTATLAKLGKDEYVALSIIEKICLTLDCPIEDVVQVKRNESDAVNLFGSSLLEAVVAWEKFLSITYKGDPPDLDTRAAMCRERLSSTDVAKIKKDPND